MEKLTAREFHDVPSLKSCDQGGFNAAFDSRTTRTNSPNCMLLCLPMAPVNGSKVDLAQITRQS
jgi:hypothetical protein